MHSIRRSALRAFAAPARTISQARPLSNTFPFTLRPAAQSVFSPAARRFASSDADRDAGSDATPSSADKTEESSLRSAIDSAAESASTYASEASASVSETASAAKDSLADYAEAAGAAAGFSAPPSGRGGLREERPRRSRDNFESRDGGRDRFENRGADRYERPERKRVLEPTNGIYVGNLLFDITEADLEREFAEFGTVKKAVVAADPRGLSKGFGYVEFDTVDSATAAIEARNQTSMNGRTVVVNYQLKTQRAARPKIEPTKSLFVGNIPFEMSDNDLNKLFRDVQNVLDVRVAIDRRTGQPRGFAHADFVDVESATKGLEQLQGKELYGRALRVDYSGGPAYSTERRGPRESREPREPREFGGDRQFREPREPREPRERY